MKKVYLYKKHNNKIVLTDSYAVVDDSDYDKVSKNKWYLMRLYHCDTSILYARRYEGSTTNGSYRAILMHREILGVSKRSQKVDHRNGDGLNNTRENIRICTHSDNMSNRKVSCKKSIKYLGVSVVTGTDKYVAALVHNGKYFGSKRCNTPEEAAIEYNKLVKKYKPEFGKLNVVPCP